MVGKFSHFWKNLNPQKLPLPQNFHSTSFVKNTLQSVHMILGQLPLRAKPSHVEAEPGGSRGTVVIVRTRVGFGVSLVGGGARVKVFERSICAPNGHFWRLWKYP